MKAKFVLKSYPAASGHKGIPGQRGGSLPSGRGTSGRGTAAPVKSKNGSKGKMPNPAGLDTMQQYTNPDGSWAPERQALHEEIINKFFQGRTSVDNPVSVILGGGPASGKSTLLNSGLVDIDPNHVLASGDDIKPFLPEYKSGEYASAAFVHEESSVISKEIASRAARGGYNVVMDGTGDNSLGALSKKISSMTTKGQTVKGIYVTCDVDTAIARNVARAKATGRDVPEAVLRSTHAAVSKIFPEIVNAGLFDNLELYDTSSGKAILIAKAAGKTLTVHDWPAYATFLNRASGKNE